MSSGIKLAQLDPTLRARVFAEEEQADRAALRKGVCAQGSLYVAANVANGDTLGFGADSYEVDIINTDSGVNTANTDDTGPIDGTSAIVPITFGAALTVAPGSVIRVENELFLCLRQPTTTQIVASGGYAGTARASHAKNLDVFVSDAVPTTISIPLVTTLTPAAFAAALVGVFNWVVPTGYTDVRPARTPTLYDVDPSTNREVLRYHAQALGTPGVELLFRAVEPGADDTATIEEFSNSTDNVWGAATLVGGVDPDVLGLEITSRVATAAEELAGQMHFVFPFDVRKVAVQVRVAASGVVKAFTGTVLAAYSESTDVTFPATHVSVRNVGAASTAYAVSFAAGDEVTVIVSE